MELEYRTIGFVLGLCFMALALAGVLLCVFVGAV